MLEVASVEGAGSTARRAADILPITGANCCAVMVPLSTSACSRW